MTTIFKFDTCQCVVEYDDGFNLIAFHNRCKIHQSAKLDDVFTHNQGYNLSGKTEVEIIQDKKIEQDRISKI